MEKLIVGFSRPKKFKIFAWAIMKVLKTDYDHVYLKFHSNTYDRDLIYQASKTMVNFVGSDLFNQDNVIFEEFEVSIAPDKKIELMQFLIDNAGKPYSVKEILGFAAMKLFKLKDNPYRQNTNEYVCSVIAAYIVEHYTDRDLNDNYQDIDPKDLYEYFKYGKI